MHTPAGLLCRGTADLTASFRGAGLTYGELVRRVAHEYRDNARRPVDAEGTGALAFSVGREMRQLSSNSPAGAFLTIHPPSAAGADA